MTAIRRAARTATTNDAGIWQALLRAGIADKLCECIAGSCHTLDAPSTAEAHMPRISSKSGMVCKFLV